MLTQLKLFKKYFLVNRQANGPEQQIDFDMYSEIVDIENYTHILKTSFLQSKVLKNITYKEKDYRIVQLDYIGSSAKKKLLIFAGVHGNEFAAALVIPELLNDLQNNPHFYQKWDIRIVAPINPVGLAYNSRYNEDGYDINRDFKYFKTPGAQVQRNVVEDFNPNILISLHESPQKGFFMFSEGKLPYTLHQSITERLRKSNVPLAEKSFFHIKMRQGIWEKPPIIYFFQRLLGIYTLGRFMHDKGILAITTESTWTDRDIEARKRPHLEVIKTVVQNPRF
ncbi:MAG TPA: DUF2817 domain-containing protein [Candidatus Limnocylindrales bacterium]|nr:DUF2817 domain-containing protein [Candidatus Limnocylindrales bacterium]